MRSCLLCLLFTAASLGAIEPAPVETRTIDRNLFATLREVHNLGADLYNRGDAAGCCRVFEGALPVAAAMLSHRLGEQKLVADALTAAKAEENVSRRAFVLHNAIERLRDKLKPAARIVEEPFVPGAGPPTGPILVPGQGKKEEAKPTPRPPLISSEPMPRSKPVEIPAKDSKAPPAEKKEAVRKEEPSSKPPLILIDEDPMPIAPNVPKKDTSTPPKSEEVTAVPRTVRKDPPTRSEGVYGLTSFDGVPLKGYEITFHSVAQPVRVYRETIDAYGFYVLDAIPKGKYTVVLIPGIASPVKAFPKRLQGLDTSPLAIEVVKSGERINFILGSMDP